ncbi:MAG: hypothetical protein EPN20_10940 [Magnetospirillum sp.]|nr:MAG: hypothetical protein EPN20_10940 [Magnetospirillum sp.]
MKADLERMRQVRDRLVDEGRESALSDRMTRYLDLFDNLPCQSRDALPVAHDCDNCGHKGVCIILPDAAYARPDHVGQQF